MLCCGIQNQGFNCSMLASSSLTCIFQTPYDGAKTAPIAGDVPQFDGLNWIFAPMASVSFDDNQVMSLTNTNTISGTMVASAPVGADNQVNYTLSINARLDPSSTFPLTSSGAGIAVGSPTTSGTQGVLGGTGVANTYIGADGLLHLLPVSSTVTTGNLTSTTTGLSLTGNTGAVVGAGTTIDYNLVTGVGALTAGVQGTLGGTGTANTYVGADGQLHLLPASATITTGNLTTTTTGLTIGTGTSVLLSNATVDYNLVTGISGLTAGAQGALGGTGTTDTYIGADGLTHLLPPGFLKCDSTVFLPATDLIPQVDQTLTTSFVTGTTGTGQCLFRQDLKYDATNKSFALNSVLGPSTATGNFALSNSSNSALGAQSVTLGGLTNSVGASALNSSILGSLSSSVTATPVATGLNNIWGGNSASITGTGIRRGILGGNSVSIQGAGNDNYIIASSLVTMNIGTSLNTIIGCFTATIAAGVRESGAFNCQAPNFGSTNARTGFFTTDVSATTTNAKNASCMNGEGLTAYSVDQTVIGSYNHGTSASTLTNSGIANNFNFILGNGNAATKHNALIFTSSGVMYRQTNNNTRDAYTQTITPAVFSAMVDQDQSSSTVGVKMFKEVVGVDSLGNSAILVKFDNDATIYKLVVAVA